jgi:hypothetical protein
MANSRNYRRVWANDRTVLQAVALLERVRVAASRVDGTASVLDVQDALRSVRTYLEAAEAAIVGEQAAPTITNVSAYVYECAPPTRHWFAAAYDEPTGEVTVYDAARFSGSVLHLEYLKDGCPVLSTYNLNFLQDSTVKIQLK